MSKLMWDFKGEFIITTDLLEVTPHIMFHRCFLEWSLLYMWINTKYNIQFPMCYFSWVTGLHQSTQVHLTRVHGHWSAWNCMAFHCSAWLLQTFGSGLVQSPKHCWSFPHVQSTACGHHNIPCIRPNN